MRLFRTLPLLAAFTLIACPKDDRTRVARAGDPVALAKSVAKAVEVEATRPASEALR